MERSSNNKSRAAWILGAAALGAAVMYVLDPEQGRRRRALARDKLYSARVKTSKSLEKKTRDLSNRANGLMTQVKKILPQTEKLPTSSTSSSEQ